MPSLGAHGRVRARLSRLALANVLPFALAFALPLCSAFGVALPLAALALALRPLLLLLRLLGEEQ
eukprot:9134202-Lingulodinium_polyedra.AAC.1